MQRGRFFLTTIWILVCGSVGFGEEIIDFKRFGLHRALILETTDRDVGHASPLGDINGDGFADFLQLSYPREDGTNEPFTEVIFGGHVLPGRVPFESAPLDRMRIVCSPSSSNGSIFNASGGVGDLDRDGIPDAILGFPYMDFAERAGGAALLLYGSERFPESTLQLEDIGGAIRGCRFTSSDLPRSAVGFQVSGIGDFNGDGTEDVAVSSWPPPHDVVMGETWDPNDRGHVFIVFGGPQLTGEVVLEQIEQRGMGIIVLGPTTEPDNNVPFGDFITGLGDINGDDLADVAVTDGRKGHVILLGHASTGETLDIRDILRGAIYDGAILVRSPNSENTRLGLGGIAGLGDLDGDGRVDMALGISHGSSSPLFSEPGRVYIVYGREEFPAEMDLGQLPLPEAAVTIFGLRTPDLFGRGLISCGDINGDGLQDVGMPSHGDYLEGDLTVLYGSREVLSGELHLIEPYSGIRIRGETGEDRFGAARALGDFNGDGLDDVVVIAPHTFPLGNPYPARCYIILGEDTSRSTLGIYVVEPAAGVQRGGTPVSIRGKGFTSDTAVWFEGRALESAQFVSDAEITGLSPAAGTTGKITVEVRRGPDVAILASGFEYTQNMPAYDVRDLGNKGLVLEGEMGVPGSRAFTWQSGSPIIFEDLNGDGVDDLAVESSATDGWYMTLVTGRRGLQGTLPAYESGPDVTVLRESDLHLGSTGKAGCYVAAIGDVNADGLEDLGIGTWDGLAFVLFGREDLLSGEDVILETEIENFSASRINLGVGTGVGQTILCGLGDVDGNGIDEFAIGHSGEAAEIRLVEVGDDWSQSMGDLASWTKSTFWSGLPLGAGIVNAGDVNGDGTNDLVVRSEVIEKRCLVFVIYGREDFPERVEIQNWVQTGGGVMLEVTDGFDSLPFAQVKKAGDVNGDGYQDILVGLDGGGEIVNQGVTYVLFGAADLPNHLEVAKGAPLPEQMIEVLGENRTEQAGRVGPASDFNADGYADFLIGGPGFQAQGQSGNVFLIYGGESLPRRIELRDLGGKGLKIDGQNVPGGAGFSVGPFGDLNGDGEPDFAFTEIGNPEEIARVYVIYGPFASKDFSRGDSNADGTLNIADAISVLTFLFSGGRPPLCMDAADADDDGSPTITDPIRVLNYLFLGADPPPLPFPDVGPDPSEDNLDCLLF